MIEVRHITDPADLEKAMQIRHRVFVEEQQVAEEEEYDEYETVSRHFLAFADAQPCGTARWRYTDKGIKLERFAVEKACRGRGVGKALVDTVLKDVAAAAESAHKMIYLHAQLSAMPLYARAGFEKEGPLFEEAGIQHYKMVWRGASANQ
ncbi:Predicted N-acyltransferase, GNAT family [Catalinimonas alkaloidigena]|uniref:Predicted N-acyltransferase, GNAT family n=1 Tax=Catalinimonas alkaloidigena TaxID=1075417 RepID=A0A1G9PAB2_9BACT|nr:GNAT family N-acetyltransferase [Catalinimonas alkaloidigena]SDL95137.1 Predicted N-acyltransferase, GNAT family [Catalinimonas alkaloidigena]